MFNTSLTHACKEYGTGGDFNDAMSKIMGFESEQEFNSVMFLREVMRFINSTSEISDIVRVYVKQPELARTRLKNLLNEHSLEQGSRSFDMPTHKQAYLISSDCQRNDRLRLGKEIFIMAKGSVRKKGKKWYYRFYVENESGNLVQKEYVGTESKSEMEKLLRKAMEDYEEKKFVAKTENITLGTLIDIWADEELKTGTLSNGTVENYLLIINRIK